jgi:hypothetical protein
MLEGPGSVRSLSSVRHDFGIASNCRENAVGRLLIRPVLGPFLFPGSGKIFVWGKQHIRVGGINSCIVYKKM